MEQENQKKFRGKSFSVTKDQYINVESKNKDSYKIADFFVIVKYFIPSSELIIFFVLFKFQNLNFTPAEKLRSGDG